MRIDMYLSAMRRGKYLVVPGGTDLANWKPPVGFDPDLVSVYPFPHSIDLQSTDKRIGIDSADVIDQVNQNGWALVEMTITVSIGP